MTMIDWSIYPMVRAATVLQKEQGQRILLRFVYILFCSLVIGAMFLVPEKASAQAKGDPGALAVAESALSALSAGSSWTSVHAAQLSGTISVPDKDGPITVPFVWEDKWKGRKIWYLHKTGAGNSERDLISNPSKGRHLRREDKTVAPVGQVATLPPFQIPGATLAVVLSDQHCEVRSAGSSRDEKDDLIRISCHPPDSAGGEESQSWAISHETHLPDSVSVILEDMRRAGSRSIEIVKFSHYQTVEGLLIPDVCEVRQVGLVRTVTVQSISFPNPNHFPSSDFEASY